jgi:hypothetical protein
VDLLLCHRLTLFANNLGIWKIPGFLNDDLVERLLQTLGENGEMTCFHQYCVGYSHKHLKHKKCFGLTDKMAIDADKGALVEEVLDHLNWVWPTNIEQQDYMYWYTQRTKARVAADQ